NPTTGSGSGNGEVALDIEMAMAMAPGLSRIVLFEGNPNNYIPNDILNTMLASNMIKNLSCSWAWSGGPSASTDNIFQLMAAAGQSFFNASGDTDAFVAGSNNDVDSASQVNAPSSSPYIIQVGGTVLNTNGFNGSYTSESVWNDRTVNANGGNWGSSGGVSTYYSIPSWQTNISMVANGGSTTKRNIPDVALTADYVYSTYDNGSASQTGGTSCAAPLWAGFMALVNQQATIGGNPPAGFINPAIYALSKTDNYTNYFHDTTMSDNSWSSSAGKFVAASGYDLATGWGTPVGQRLINALSGEPLGISPGNMLALSGPTGGPFSPSSVAVQLTNAGNSALNWSLVNTSAWLKVSFTNGPIAGHVVTNLDLSLTVTASNLVVGSYGTTLIFSNNTSHVAQNVSFALQVINPLSVSPSTGFTAVGPVGGAFVPSSQGFNLVNLSGAALNWSLVNTSAWLNVSSAGGPLAAGAQTNVNINVPASANALAAGVYNATVTITNPIGVAAVMPFALKVGQPVIQNGGFETGDFTSWTQSGNTATTTVTSGNTSYVHGGSYGAQLGPSGTPGYLSQNLATVMGQNYLLSLWLRNKAGSTPNLFQVQWNGVMLYNVVNMTATAWTNLQFLVTATNSGSVLQFGFRDDPSYLGLDDITV
ncbi:MAG: hypothetical protein JF609_11100, partial [Verrucomicrobia bacterium]|nr:hypothetical protein [Verrucomicrobiota bacterium]